MKFRIDPTEKVVFLSEILKTGSERTLWSAMEPTRTGPESDSEFR